MVNSLVARATSDMLIGPDWAMNIEISDILNHDPVQAKDIVKGIKRHIRRTKKPKVQFLALSLLETIVKNCGDIVHMHVAEKDLPHEMVKIAKKKCDYQVKEKILILIDTWQEAFGGSRARYPQYFAAYQELLRAGAVFPPRSERSAPVSTPPQLHPLSSYSQNARNSALNHEDARSESSVEAEYPTLSLSEIQNARGSMDVLAEMISAIDPGNKESLKQEALVDLVEQCRTYKQRVVHLVNSTVDESLLCQGLALNDDLQRVLAKYESIVSREGDKEEKSTPESITRDLVDVGSPRKLIDAGESSEQANQSNTLEANTSPSAANGTATTPMADPKMDLLSGDLLGGDDYGSPTQNSLALVPVSAPQPSTLVASEQNALVLFDMFSENPQQGSPYQNGVTPNMGSPYDPSGYPQASSPSWGAQSTPLPQQSSSPYGAQNEGSLPPPPWELQATDNTQPFSDPYAPTIQSPRMNSLGLPTVGTEQVVGMYVQPITGSQLAAINQPFQTPMYPQHLQGAQMPGLGPMQPTQMTPVYPQAMYGHQMAGYGYNGYGQQPEDAQYLDQRMYGLSVKDDTAVNGSASSQASMASYLPPMKQQPKGDDKLFGDLVNMAKLKPATSAPPPARTGSM